MAGVLPTLSSMITPEMVSNLSKRFGLSDELTRRGLMIANIIIAGGMARAGSTAEGRAKLNELVENADSGIMSNLTSVLTGAGGDPNQALNAPFGHNLPLITEGARKATGIDITPMLAICTPVVLAIAKNVTAQQKLDAEGLTKLLDTEIRGLSRRDPANAKVVKEVFRPLEAQTKLRATFSDEEWAKLKEAPAYAAAMVILADRSSGSGRKAEIEALSAAVQQAAANAGPAELIGVLFADGVATSTVEALVRDHRKTSDEELHQVLTAPVTEAIALVQGKASVGDATTYKGMLIDIAQKVANAAKEGGFMGVGGLLVSEDEKRAIDELAAMVAAD